MFIFTTAEWQTAVVIISISLCCQQVSATLPNNSYDTSDATNIPFFGVVVFGTTKINHGLTITFVDQTRTHGIP